MLVSVIIPHYNRSSLLDRAIESVLNQNTTAEIEIIVIDDCSYQKPVEIKNPLVQYFYNKKNMGPGFCRNLALKYCIGDFISFLDCDDYWHVDFLESTINSLLKNENCVMAYSNTINVDFSGDQMGLRRGKIFNVKRILPDIFIKGRPWCTSSCLWRGSVVKKNGFWPSSRSWEDYAFDTSVAMHNNAVIPIEKPLVYYNISGSDKLSYQSEILRLNEKLISTQIITQYLIESKEIFVELSRIHFAQSLFSLILQSAAFKQRALMQGYLKLLIDLGSISRIQKIIIEQLPFRIVPFLVKYLRSK